MKRSRSPKVHDSELQAEAVSGEPDVTLDDYRALAALRYEIRKFLAFSERAARTAGIEPQQHQLLLALKGLPEAQRPTIRVMAERLSVQHHTAVALVDKLEARGLVKRERGVVDRREVLVRLTDEAAVMLGQLSALHRDQLQRVGPGMVSALTAIVEAHVDMPTLALASSAHEPAAARAARVTNRHVK
jgi:DNA-binding MarR family transcriptional regulator